MSYEPTNWQTGDVVTSAKLNKLEQGVANAGGGVLVVHSSDDDPPVLDKTWKEIHDAALIGVVIHNNVVGDQMETMYLSSTNIYDGEYQVAFANEEVFYITDSENGYPAYSGS